VVGVWNVETGEEQFTLPGHWPVTNALAFSCDGKTLAAGVGDRLEGSETGEVKLWDVDSADWKADLLGSIERAEGWPQGSVWSLAFSPDGRLLAVGTGVQNIVLWDVAADRVRTILRQGSGVRSLAFSPDGWRLASAAGYDVRVWNLAKGGDPFEIQGHRGVVWSVAFSPDGRMLTTGSSDRTTRLWDVETGRQLAAYDWHAGKTHSVAFAPDGMSVAAGAERGAVVLWDVEVC
jgi:WD40 repeat protein